MGSQISPAIIMRTTDYGESDVLVGFFTRDKGRLKGVAKGARRSRRRFVNCLDVFSLVSLEYDLKRRGELHFLHSGRLINGFSGLRKDFFSLALAGYLIELTETLFPLGVSDPGMFALLESALGRLDQGESRNALRVLIEARAMSLGGYGIGLDACCKCGRTYVGEGRAVFVPERGGIACMRCARETTLSPGLEPAAVKGLKNLQSDNPGEPPLPDEVIQTLKPVLKLHISYRVGKAFRTGAYLE